MEIDALVHQLIEELTHEFIQACSFLGLQLRQFELHEVLQDLGNFWQAFESNIVIRIDQSRQVLPLYNLVPHLIICIKLLGNHRIKKVRKRLVRH